MLFHNPSTAITKLQGPDSAISVPISSKEKYSRFEFSTSGSKLKPILERDSKEHLSYNESLTAKKSNDFKFGVYRNNSRISKLPPLNTSKKLIDPDLPKPKHSHSPSPLSSKHNNRYSFTSFNSFEADQKIPRSNSDFSSPNLDNGFYTPDISIAKKSNDTNHRNPFRRAKSVTVDFSKYKYDLDLNTGDPQNENDSLSYLSKSFYGIDSSSYKSKSQYDVASQSSKTTFTKKYSDINSSSDLLSNFAQMDKYLSQFSSILSPKLDAPNLKPHLQNLSRIYSKMLANHSLSKSIAKPSLDKLKALSLEKTKWDAQKKEWDAEKQEWEAMKVEWEKSSKQENKRKSIKLDREKRLNTIKELEMKELADSESKWKARAVQSETDLSSLKETLEDLVDMNKNLKNQIKELKSSKNNSIPQINSKPEISENNDLESSAYKRKSTKANLEFENKNLESEILALSKRAKDLNDIKLELISEQGELESEVSFIKDENHKKGYKKKSNVIFTTINTDIEPDDFAKELQISDASPEINYNNPFGPKSSISENIFLFNQNKQLEETSEELERWKSSYFFLNNMVTRILKISMIFKSASERIACLENNSNINNTSSLSESSNDVSNSSAFITPETESKILEDDEKMLFAAFEQPEIQNIPDINFKQASETYQKSLENVFSTVEDCYSNFKQVRDFLIKTKTEKSTLLRKLGKKERQKLPSWNMIHQWGDEGKFVDINYSRTDNNLSSFSRPVNFGYANQNPQNIQDYNFTPGRETYLGGRSKHYSGRKYNRNRSFTEQQSSSSPNSRHLDDPYIFYNNQFQPLINAELEYQGDLVSSDEYNELVTELEMERFELAKYKNLCSKMETLMQQMRISLDRSYMDLNNLRYEKNQLFIHNRQQPDFKSNVVAHDDFSTTNQLNNLPLDDSTQSNFGSDCINELNTVTKFIENTKAKNSSFFGDVNALFSVLDSLQIDSKDARYNPITNKESNNESNSFGRPDSSYEANNKFEKSNLDSYSYDDSKMHINKNYTLVDFLVNKPDPTEQICETWFQLVNAYAFISRRLLDALVLVIEKHMNNKFNSEPINYTLMNLDEQLNKVKELEILVSDKMKEYNTYILSKFNFISSKILFDSSNSDPVYSENQQISRYSNFDLEDSKDYIISIRNSLLGLEHEVFTISSDSIELLNSFIYENPLLSLSNLNMSDNFRKGDSKEPNEISYLPKQDDQHNSPVVELNNRIKKIHKYYESQIAIKNTKINQLQLDTNNIKEKAETKIASYMLIQNYQHVKLTNILEKNEFYSNLIRLSSSIIGGPSVILQSIPSSGISKHDNPPIYFWKKAKKVLIVVRLYRSLNNLLKKSSIINLLKSEVQNLKNVKS
ncbi:hypothetical protein AYI69_g9994 [Smittium culicis]|uniref:Uncharacterized protein n=1 Tax=Smittium culicis TaxID=133412 RepID=A0A1R1X8X4_9FUNG|nr:hypothetical protein AYI69_g9994 [Smittium culicis]